MIKPTAARLESLANDLDSFDVGAPGAENRLSVLAERVRQYADWMAELEAGEGGVR